MVLFPVCNETWEFFLPSLGLCFWFHKLDQAGLPEKTCDELVFDWEFHHETAMSRYFVASRHLYSRNSCSNRLLVFAIYKLVCVKRKKEFVSLRRSRACAILPPF